MDDQRPIILNGEGRSPAVKVRAVTDTPCEDKDEDWDLLDKAVSTHHFFGVVVSNTSSQIFLGTSFCSCELWLRGEFYLKAKGSIFYFYFFPQSKAATSVSGEFKIGGIFHYDSGSSFPKFKANHIIRKVPGWYKWRLGTQRKIMLNIMWVLLMYFHEPINVHCNVITLWLSRILAVRVHLTTVMEAWHRDLESLIPPDIRTTHLPLSLT